MATNDTAGNSAPNKFTLLSDDEFCTFVQRSHETLMKGDGATVEDAATFMDSCADRYKEDIWEKGDCVFPSPPYRGKAERDHVLLDPQCHARVGPRRPTGLQRRIHLSDSADRRQEMQGIRIFGDEIITSMAALFNEFVFPLKEADVYRLWEMLGAEGIESPWTFVEFAPKTGAFAIDYRGYFDHMAIGVTRPFASPSQTALDALDDNFSQVVQAITTVLGTPDERTPDVSPMITWRLKNGGAIVVIRGSMVHLHLESPASAAFNPADISKVFNENQGEDQEA